MKKDKVFTLGELFCGPGGLAWGAMHASVPGMKIVHAWANDYDADTCKTYTRNICSDSPETVYCEDVHKLNIDKLGEISALAFGFPCNDFSVVGEQLGFKGKFGPLYTYGIKVLEKYKPEWFLAENVGGIKSANDGTAFERIQKDMIAAGYRIYPNLYHFEDYGIPQARHRMIIIGIREDLPYEFRVTRLFLSTPASLPFHTKNAKTGQNTNGKPATENSLAKNILTLPLLTISRKNMQFLFHKLTKAAVMLLLHTLPTVKQ